MAYSHTGMTQKKTLRNLELFATKVMHLFKEKDEAKMKSVAAS